jgi:Na+/H+ antiporter NhaD/arsenite permease-like protein
MSSTIHSHPVPAERPVIRAIVGLILVYTALWVGGTFQRPGHQLAATDHSMVPQAIKLGESHLGTSPAGGADASQLESGHLPDFWAVVPFLVLLGAIAVCPLTRYTERWWESNLHRFYVALLLASTTLAYYLFIIPGGGAERTWHVFDHAILSEYIPFIVLLFSLYTVSGGVRIEGDLVARPSTNAAFIGLGGLLASFVGTTGAAMLLIRPLLETNHQRRHVQHTVVFFIFVVCNCGGCLLPIGDPPLFLGYLQGVGFLWTAQHLLPAWLATNALLLAIYYLWDRLWCYPREAARDRQRDDTQLRPLRITGLYPNLPLLIGIILAVALLDPTKAVPGTAWHPPLYLREVVQLAMVALSLGLGRHEIRQANHFNYHAILEVAALFVGIFICMQPAIEILNHQGPALGIASPTQYFWATGLLSSVLDNAPTYLVFFKTAAASFPHEDFTHLVEQSGPAQHQLIAISLGAVFMGAMTYVGNGPNFMVRAIAEQMGVRMPSFFGYVLRYSIPVLLPLFAVASWFFLS